MTQRQEQAALLIAQGRLTIEEMAAEIGIPSRTLDSWKARADIKARVKEHQDLWAAELKKYGLGCQDKRLADLQRVYDGLLEAIAERSQHPGLRKVAGGKTGLVTREIRKVENVAVDVPPQMPGGEKTTKIVRRVQYRYRLDLPTIQELREIQKQVAIELGQWSERRELSGKVQFEPLRFTEAEKAMAALLTPEQRQKLDAILSK